MDFKEPSQRDGRKQQAQVIYANAERSAQRQELDEYPVPHRNPALVHAIDTNVGKLLGAESLDWKKKDCEFAVFHRSEIWTGRRIGSGAFSEVYEVKSFFRCQTYQQNSNFKQSLVRESLAKEPHLYAIKHLHPIFLESPERMALAGADLVLEAQFLSSLQHTNILPIHGWSVGGTEAFGDGSPDGYFLVVEKLYETLNQRIERWCREKILNSDLFYECARIGTQIASALAYLHSKDIIFRDLKPKNVGFDANDDIKIFSFGIKRELQSFNDAFKFSCRIGTVRAMSPECDIGKEEGMSSDVYSLSMVLYEMLNRGGKPVACCSHDAQNLKVSGGGERPPMDDCWPIMMQDLLERSWSPNIAERPTMAEIENRLQDLMMDLLEELVDS